MSVNSLHSVVSVATKVWMQILRGAPLDKELSNLEGSKEIKSAVQSVIYTTQRNRALAIALSNKLMDRKSKPVIEALIQVSLVQIIEGRRSVFAIVNECVKASKFLDKNPRVSGFVNAVLRRFCREKDELIKQVSKDETVLFNAPNWWIKRYQDVFGTDSKEVFEVQKKHPPMTLRVNQRKLSRGDYKAKLDTLAIESSLVGDDGIVLKNPVRVEQIPGFMDGEVSVQDAGSQLAAKILGVKNGMRVLDACSAPGGKTAHLAEIADLDLLALEIDPLRARRIHENLSRLGLSCEVKVSDSGNVDKWWDGEKFDRILLDAPCTASGIVRRHPDIPWVRRPEDIQNLAKEQNRLLENLWPLLAKGGRLLYAVCSVFPEEGVNQISNFISTHSDAVMVPFCNAPKGYLRLKPSDEVRENGTSDCHDGFFYALIEKS